MLSRLQELKREEEILLRIKAALHDQLNRLKVEELALQSMIRSRDEVSSAGEPEEPEQTTVQVDDEAVINLTELQLSTQGLRQQETEEEEEIEVSDS